MNDWIQTFSGRRFWPLEPKPGDVAIEDIAHALSLTCRYGGHCKAFYSVAEHSLLVFGVIRQWDPDNPIHQLMALLHDAAEAYLADVPRPVKPYLLGYGEIESRLNRVIADAFGLATLEKTDDIEIADTRILVDEAEALMPVKSHAWHRRLGRPLGVEIACLPPERAEALFLETFHELKGKLE